MKNLLNLIIVMAIFLSGCETDEEETYFEDITAMEASNVNSGGFQANWNKVKNAESYSIEVASDIDFVNMETSAEIQGADNNFYLVKNLEKNKKYYYRVNYSISGKSSDYSNVIDVITYSYITALEATKIMPTGFQANWRVVENADKYEIEIAKEKAFSTILKSIEITNIQNDSIVIDDLEKDITYYYRIRYYIENEPSEYSNIISVTTNYVLFTHLDAIKASNISPMGFQANWETKEDAESYELELSVSNDFTNIIETYEITEGDIDSIIITGLSKNVTYYYRLRYFVWEKASDYSNVISVKTNLLKNDIDINTNGIVTRATISYKLDIPSSTPAIIFLHMGSSNRAEWTSNELFQMCVDSGYVALAYDLRGHGESEGTIDWDTFTTDPDLLPKDLDDVISYMQGNSLVDPDRIAMVGGSMGAILATGASSYPEVKSVIALTSFYDAVNDLYGTSNINTVFYIAGENDNAEESQSLYDVTNDPKKLKIIEGSSSHSAALINTEELRNEAFNWLVDYL